MSRQKIDKYVIRTMEVAIAAVLVLIPFHAFLTVWTSSLVGHYTLLRLWKEVLLTGLVCGSIYLLAIDKKLRQRFISVWVIRAMLIYLAMIAVWFGFELLRGEVTSKAVWYGALVDARFFVFFITATVVVAKSDWLRDKWRIWLLAPAILVAAFAIAQYLILPYDFLRHFGYGVNTISPYETINNSIEHIRVASTLRGANPLGAYLILPICAMVVLLFKEKRERIDKIILTSGLVMALVFSFSRSAWIGALAGASLAVYLLSSKASRRIFIFAALAVATIAIVISLSFKNNHTFENVILHTEEGTTAKISSNEGHASALSLALRDIGNQPLGGGVGTAGPQSTYNKNSPKIAENYYLQIGQEMGVIGLMAFGTVVALVAVELWRGRKDTLVLALLVSFLGLGLVNLLSHAWSDDTLAYVWWGMAGIALSPAILKNNKQKSNGKS